MSKILVTGGAGFIGSNFIRYLLNKTNKYQVINLDKLTYAGNLMNLKDVSNSLNYGFIKGSINDKALVEKILMSGVDYIINFAAESHVDKSIKNSELFLQTNILGVNSLLESARKYDIKKFIQISTDEVYGSTNDSQFVENSSLKPSSPYSSSKASADLLTLSYFKTFGVPVVITRCSNNYGPYQFPEKLIPLMVIKAIQDMPLPVYGDGMNVRDWIHVLDHCRAIEMVLKEGKLGEIYNVGANSEKTNLEVIYTILDILNKPKSLVQFIEDRPGHDRRYSINSSKLMNEIGWKPLYNYEEGIFQTVNWYKKNKSWWKDIISGKYLEYNKTPLKEID